MVKIYKGIPYTGTLPAVLTGTKAGYLHRYKIYGNLSQSGTPTPENPIVPSECGERTENLFSGEFSQFDNVGGTGNTYAYFYIPEDFTLTLIAKDTHTIPINTYLGITKDGGQSTGGFTWVISQRWNVTEGDRLTVKSSTNGYHYVSMYQKAASTLSWILEHYYVMLNLGSTAPTSYIPYGYKLPLLSGSTPVDIYIGDTPLGTDEYVDYGEQKIYKRTENLFDKNGKDTASGYLNNNYLRSSGTIVSSSESEVSEYISVTVGTYYTISRNHEDTVRSSSICFYNASKEYISGVSYDNRTVVTVQAPNDAAYARYSVRKAYEATSMLTEGSTAPTSYIPYLQPTDPPVPFPQIPTSANSTTISWAGQGLAPSEFDSIQEWVDIPTYKRVNGEWVADN